MTVTTNKKQFAPISDSSTIAISSGNELLPFIEKDNLLLIDARLLHQKLSSKQDFSNWIKNRIDDFSFIENKDFSIKLSKSRGGRRGIDYLLTLDMAKELAMLERSEIGQQIRRYFIASEKVLRSIPTLPKEESLFDGIELSIIDAGRFYHYKQILERCGYNPKIGYSRRKTYPSHFIQQDRQWFISEELATHIYRQKAVFNNRSRLAVLIQDAPPASSTQNEGGN